MSNSPFSIDLLQQGQHSMAVLKEGGSIHRIQPVPVIQEIQFYDFSKDVVKDFKLDSQLDKDYEIVGLDFDIPEDDKKELTDGNDRPSNILTSIQIRTFFEGNQSKRYFFTTAERVLTYGKTFLNHKHDLQIKCTRNIKVLTFYGIPIYLNKPIVFV